MAATEGRVKADWPAVHMRYAWLITWVGTEPWAAPDDWRSIMAIISGRRSRKFIEDVLWLLDMRAKRSGYGMAYYANRRRKSGLPYRSGSGIRLGVSSLFLYARQVTDLRVIRDDTQETIQWIEPDDRGNDPNTHQLTPPQPGWPRSVTRSVDEYIGGEPYHRRWT